MTDFIALSEEEGRAATRRAAHLLALLTVDNDPAGFQREIHRLAIGDDADPVFVAQVAARAVQLAHHVIDLGGAPIEARRELVTELMASNAPSDAADLDEDPS